MEKETVTSSSYFEEGMKYHEVKDYEKAFGLFNKGYELGDPECANKVAVYYFYGNFVEQDINKAISIFHDFEKTECRSIIENLIIIYDTNGHGHLDSEKARYYLQKGIELKIPYAFRRLGASYFYGSHHEKDLQKAIEYYKKATELGEAAPYGYLGDIYRLKKYGMEDASLSFSYYQKGAELNDKYCLRRMGVVYRTGNDQIGINACLQQSIDYFKKAIELGDSESYGYLGDMYRVSRYGLLDEKTAYYYYQKGYEADDSYSSLKYGVAYMFGKPQAEIDPDIDKAIEIFLKTISLGENEAYGYLGDIYRIKKYNKVDEALALSYYQKGADHDDGYCSRRVAMAYQKELHGLSKDIEKAIEYFKKAGEHGDGVSYGYLGDFYRLKQYKMIDNDLCLSYYQKGADLDDTYCLRKLGLFYKDGEFCEKDLKKAYKYLNKARAAYDDYSSYVVARSYIYGLDGFDVDKAKGAEILKWFYDNGKYDSSCVREYISCHIFDNDLKDYELAKEVIETVLPHNQEKGKLLNLYGYLTSRLDNEHKNIDKGIQYFMEAINHGYIYSYDSLACLYANKEEKCYNLEKAFWYFKGGYDAKEETASVKYAKCYLNGEGVNKDTNKAIDILQSVVKRRMYSAYGVLGETYSSSKYDLLDDQQAFKYYLLGAKHNDRNSLLALSEWYQLGRFVRKNLKKSKKYLEKATEIEAKVKYEVTDTIEERIMASFSKRLDKVETRMEETHSVVQDNNSKLVDIKNMLSSLISVVKQEKEKYTMEYNQNGSDEQNEPFYSHTTDGVVMATNESSFVSQNMLLISETKNEIINIMQLENWNKLQLDSKRFISTGRFIFNELIKNNDMDFSSVCLMLCKAIEMEFKKRLYDQYIRICLEPKYNDDYSEYPSMFVRKANSKYKLEDSNKVTLGSLFMMFKDRDNLSEKDLSDRGKLKDYLDSIINYSDKIKNKEEAFNFFKENLDVITNKYRNKACHTGVVEMETAKECMEFILTGAKFLKASMELFKE